MGRSEEALTILNSLIALRDKILNERYVIPFGHWEKGELMYKKGNITEAERAFAQVLAFKGYYDVSFPHRFVACWVARILSVLPSFLSIFQQFSDVLRNRVRLSNIQIEKDKKEKSRAK